MYLFSTSQITNRQYTRYSSTINPHSSSLHFSETIKRQIYQPHVNQTKNHSIPCNNITLIHPPKHVISTIKSAPTGIQHQQGSSSRPIKHIPTHDFEAISMNLLSTSQSPQMPARHKHTRKSIHIR
ncbi:hypothetical protein HKD37_17G048059 [Glycine soja]